MTSKPENSQKTVYIEYCRSCDTHNWCTHHDETKYHHTFLKLSELLAERFPDIEVIGNMVPPHLIPFKISENKYIDSQTNKYVVYPQIGSFQVRFNNVTVYSKKDNNAWPNLGSIVSKIGSIKDPNYNSPPKIEKALNSSKKEEEINIEKPEENGRFLKVEDEKVKVYKDQSKGFTLTDHFKLYRQKTKHEDKDWLTEKPQSQGSFRQFSQQFRGQSRQKSEKSQEQKRPRDFNGQTKLKQMLKSRGLMLKQQGKKEMIVKLDSIEEENANYQEGNGATQRTEEISSKKNKMRQLEDEFSSLQNRFKNFENRVHDIHTKKRQFQYKQQPSNQHSRLKNGQVRNEECIRKQSKKQQVAQKENFYFYQRPNKLDQYLNASQEEKNQKLQKIYGEWKYLKQTAQKNKKLLKNKRRNSQEQQSSEQQSQTHSNSSSYIANVITFKPKNDKSTPKPTQNLSKEKGHKYSTLEKYDSNKVLVTQPKFKTGEHFYTRSMKNQQHLISENQQQLTHTSDKLMKKTLGNMSLQALKKYGSKEALFNLQRPHRGELSQFSESAQNNIRQIQSRITNIQNKLKAQKESQETPSFGKPTFDAVKNVYSNNKSRSNSQASNYSAKNENKRQNQNKNNNNQNNFRNSHRHSNQKNLRNVAKPKAGYKGKTCISQTPSNDVRKEGASRYQAIQQENELLDSNNPTFVEQRQEIKNNRLHFNRSVNKKNSPNNYRLQSRQRGNRETTQNIGTSTLTKNQPKILKAESNQNFNVSEPKKIKNAKQSNYDDQRISKMETDVTQNNEQYYEKTQKQSRIRNYPLNQQVTYLRKKKEWRQSQPVKKNKKQRQLRQSEEEQISRSQDQQDNLIENSEEASRLSESKQTVFKVKNQMKSIQRQNSNTPKKSKTKHSEQPELNQQRQKTQFGCIRKNKSHQHDVFRSTERQLQDRERHGEQDQQMRADNHGDIENEEQEREQYELERQQEECNGQSAENQQIESNAFTSQHENIGNYGQQESTPAQKKKYSNSQKSQIKKANRKQNLSYYKSEQVCFQVEKKQNTVSNHESSLHSEKTQTNELQRKSSIHQQTSGKSIQNGVSGWKLNSDQEGYSDQIIINAQEQSAENHEEELEYEQQENSKLKNSLDMELENDVQQLTESEEQKQSAVKKQQKQGVNHKGVAVQNQNIIQNSQQKLSQQKQQKECIQKKETAVNSKHKSIKAKLKESKIKNTTIIKTELQSQSLITKHYTQYLTQKLAATLAKQSTKVEPTKTQIKQTMQYQDCDMAINLIICPSISSIGSHQSIPTVPASFMDYQPTLQQQPIEQQCFDEENEPSQGYDLDSVEENDAQIEQQKSKVNKSVNLNKLVLDYVNAMNRNIIDSTCQKTFQGQQITAINTPKNKKQAKNEPLHPTASIQSQISTQQHSTSPALNRIKQTITPPKHSLSTFQQENNVYTQPQQANKFKQIGIQKQLTLEVSIQTDHPPQDLTADLFMLRGNSAKSNDAYNPPTSRQSHKRKAQETIFQQNNPLKNNYFSQSKQESLFQKKKPTKQLERAHIIDKIYSPNVQLQAKKFNNLIAGAESDIQKEQGPVIKMMDFYLQGELFSLKGIEPQLIQTKFTRLLKVAQILCEKSEWLITRLFQDRNGILKEKGFGVWICKQYQWQSIIVDDALIVNEENRPLYSFHRGFQMWFNVLEKAVAIALGGYENLMKAETGQLFTMLTGCNAITSKIKQDPSKNSKLLLLINDCLRKNYVIHAQKSDKSKKESRENIYYIKSIRKAGGDEETLIGMSQNDRESFWIKLSKFVTEFCKIEILQLRINHNFTHLDLGIGRPGQLTVVQLEFQQETQGCVTLSYLGQSGALRAFLYKQEKNKVLKLIGQAKQKNKSHLFFECSFTEGKYYIFAQTQQRPARLAFLGESHPRLSITEQIYSQGLKNEMAEYLPVRQNDDLKMKRSDMDSQLEWHGRIPRLQDNFVQSRLRENFISYVLGKTKY